MHSFAFAEAAVCMIGESADAFFTDFSFEAAKSHLQRHRLEVTQESCLQAAQPVTVHEIFCQGENHEDTHSN